VKISCDVDDLAVS